MMAGRAADGVVFLLDVDNTLLDNDRFSADLDAWLVDHVGAAEQARYRRLYEELRRQHGYADYLGALERLRAGLEDQPALLDAADFMLDYPFADLLYPRALEAIAALGRFGRSVILSDGDIVFQPRKIRRAGLWQAVDGRVLIYVHKQQRLAAMQRAFPASHYVVVEDKPELLAELKRALGERASGVFVRQGHYAARAVGASMSPPPDYTIEHVAELADLDFSHLAAAARPPGKELS